MNTAVLSSIVNSDSLPSIPAVAFKVLEMCRQDNVNLKDVAAVIEKDPALTAKMMKVSNSSLFGMSKKVATIQQALVVLGIRTVKIMALGFSLVDSMNDESKAAFDYPGYWRRSLTTAVGARQLAEIIGNVRRDEAFVGGLLCDIGLVAAARHPEGIYTPIIERHRTESGRIQDIEQAVLGITHTQISAMMLANWSMPEVLSHAVAAHHGEDFEELDGRAQDLARVLWAASDISELFCGDTEATDLDAVRERTQALIGIGNEKLEEAMEGLNEQVREAADLFSVELAQEISYGDLRQNAMMQLATLTMNAEKERVAAETEAVKARSQLVDLSQRNASLKKQAETDGLTGIANRQAFDRQLADNVNHATSMKSDLGLILIDLDHFKRLNDRHGHLAGDEALRMVGKCLNKISDNTCFAARYGGEEFAMVVADVAARELRALAEDVRKNIGRIHFDHEGTELNFTASIGAAHVSFDEENVEPAEMIRRADGCLYDAKREGRNRVEVTF